VVSRPSDPTADGVTPRATEPLEHGAGERHRPADSTVPPVPPPAGPTAALPPLPPADGQPPTRTDAPADPGQTGTEGPGTPRPDVGTDDRPSRVGRFVVLGEVARGGMGVVYRARDDGVGRDVAVKALHARLRDRPGAAARFVEEARITGRLQHPGVPPVFEVGQAADGTPFLAMRLVKGRTLDDLLGGGSAPHLLPAFEQVCQAVAYAHDRGVIHRDLKPANILLTADGAPKVADFGVAKLTRSGVGLTASGAILGTPSYMAPEQARGEAKGVGPAADVWAPGATLYECLTGARRSRGPHPPTLSCWSSTGCRSGSGRSAPWSRPTWRRCA
jgi:serine/threonine protein kinase